MAEKDAKSESAETAKAGQDGVPELVELKGEPKAEPKVVKGNWTLALVFSAAAACGSPFIFGFNIGAINAPGEFIKTWLRNESIPYVHGVHSATEEQAGFIFSLAVSAFPLGAIFGSMVSGIAADKLGRKTAMLMNNAICFLGGIVMAISKATNAYPVLIVGRLIIGVNCGLNSNIGPMYLTEIAPPNLRGMLGTTNQLMVTVSIWTSNVLGFSVIFGSAARWPWLLGFTVVPGIWQVCTLPFCPESPKYLLIVKKKPEEAEKALRTLRKTSDVIVEMQVMQEEVDAIAKAPKVKFGDMFKNPMLRWALVISMMMMLAQQFSGINAAMFFSGTIFKDYANLTDHDKATGASLGMNSVNVAMTIVSTMIVDRLGRRILMLTGMTGMLLSSICIVICLHMVMSKKYPIGAAMYFTIIFICLFVASFAIGPGPIPWFFVNEVFDSGSKGNASSVAAMTNWFATFIIAVSFESWQKLTGPFAFGAFISCLTFFIGFTYFCLPETKGRSVDDVQRELQQKAPCK